jgi:uncharacterized protein (TIGR01244 family)
MNIYKITPKYHVTGVLKPESVGQLQLLGIVKVICNRPDSEAPFEEQSELMRIAVTEAGMAFDYNPVTMTSFSPELVRRQTDAVLNANGGVLAYCATGRRCTMLWAFGFAHLRAPEDLIQQAARAGMDIASMKDRLERIYHSGQHY